MTERDDKVMKEKMYDRTVQDHEDFITQRSCIIVNCVLIGH